MSNKDSLATPLQIANVILALLVNQYEEYKLTPLKLGKLVYVIYAWYYTMYNEELFINPITVGNRGPVVEAIDSQFGIYTDNIIPQGTRANTYNVDTKTDVGDLEFQKHQKVIQLASICVEYYKDKSGDDMSNITHKNELQNEAKIGDNIDKQLMKERAEKAIKECIAKLKSDKNQ